jgi:predicted enzyme related to lactoylglutathione lyase
MNRVTHFEIPAGDPGLLMDFFSKTFGWKFTEFIPGIYWSAETGENDAPGINGGLMKRRDPQQPVVNAIHVADIDAAIDNVKANGGTIVVEKMEVPPGSWLAYFKDPDGNIHGLWQKE